MIYDYSNTLDWFRTKVIRNIEYRNNILEFIKVQMEFLLKDVKVIEEPRKTDYGSYEFVTEDIDGKG